MRFLPPLTSLLHWRSEIDGANTLSTQRFYVDSEFGKFDIDCTRDAVKLIQAKDVKQSVKQELDWFALERLNPRVILQPSTVSINNFRSLIHNHPMDNEIQGLNMVPGELARLCCKRYLSGDHVHWIIDKLNMQQNKVLCIYLNRVIDIERFANKKKR